MCIGTDLNFWSETITEIRVAHMCAKTSVPRIITKADCEIEVKYIKR